MEEQCKQQAEQAAQWPQRFNPEDGTGVPFDASFGQAGFAAQPPFPPNFPPLYSYRKFGLSFRLNEGKKPKIF